MHFIDVLGFKEESFIHTIHLIPDRPLMLQFHEVILKGNSDGPYILNLIYPKLEFLLTEL